MTIKLETNIRECMDIVAPMNRRNIGAEAEQRTALSKGKKNQEGGGLQGVEGCKKENVKACQ